MKQTSVVTLLALFALVATTDAGAASKAYRRHRVHAYPEAPLPYRREVNFRSPCIEAWRANILRCAPAIQVLPSPYDTEAANDLSAYNPRQHRPYATLSPWDR